MFLLPSGHSSKFCQQMNDYTETYSILYREIILLSKELTEKSVDFASKLNSMQRLMSQMAELQKKVQCQS